MRPMADSGSPAKRPRQATLVRSFPTRRLPGASLKLSLNRAFDASTVVVLRLKEGEAIDHSDEGWAEGIPLIGWDQSDTVDDPLLYQDNGKAACVRCTLVSTQDVSSRGWVAGDLYGSLLCSTIAIY
jgi:hypothetical protein